MKKILCSLFVLASFVASAQTSGNDVVYLKNGSRINGVIIKNEPDSITAIRTADGSMFVYNNKEVLRTVINNASTTNNGPAYVKKNALWVGFNLEPQFQNIFKSRRELLNYQQQIIGGDIKLPGSGGVQLGAKICYMPLGPVGFETGLQYHYYQSQEVFSELYNNVTLYSYSHNQFHNLEIPVLINFHGKGNKVRFYSSDGISAGVTLGAHHLHSYYAAGYPTQDTSFSTHADSTTAFYCTILVSAGVQINLSKSVYLNIAAAFRISSSGVLGATNPTYVPNSYPFVPYSLGVNLEIMFRTPGRTKSSSGDFSVLSGSLTDNTPEQRNLDKAKAKHAGWNDCFIISPIGDTIKGKVQKSTDYRLTGGLFAKGKVLFAHTDDSEEKIAARQFAELYIPKEDSGYRKYITVGEDADVINKKIYRVVVDGKCQLLSQNIYGSTEPLGMEPDEIEKFAFFYKGQLMATNVKAASYKNAAFIGKCMEFFSDCPGLVQKIESQTIPSGNLIAIVKEFNKCIASRK